MIAVSSFGRFAQVYLALFLFLLAVYFPAVVSKYAFSDDYHFVFRATHHGMSELAGALVASGRPVCAALVSIFTLVSRIGISAGSGCSRSPASPRYACSACGISAKQPLFPAAPGSPQHS
jgi:hypothetical protein